MAQERINQVFAPIWRAVDATVYLLGVDETRLRQLADDARTRGDTDRLAGIAAQLEWVADMRQHIGEERARTSRPETTPADSQDQTE